MWGTLKNHGHIEFYEECHRGRQSESEDWMPMVRAIEYLQSGREASKLYAFTSLYQFHLTTAPGYETCDEHCSISIIWRWPERRFHIAFGRLGNGWVNDRVPEIDCDQSSFARSIEPFIVRLLRSSPANTDGFT